MRPKQLIFNSLHGINQKAFGGSYRAPKNKKSNGKTETRGRPRKQGSIKGNPREARPISIKRPMHLVMRSTRATESRSFLIPERALKIQLIIRKQEKKFGVKIYRYANSGNHLHMIILPRSRAAFHGFLRSISGLIARETMGWQKGIAEKNSTHFWDARPFTRILEWGRSFTTTKQYLTQNTLEAFGFIPFKLRLNNSYG